MNTKHRLKSKNVSIWWKSILYFNSWCQKENIIHELKKFTFLEYWIFLYNCSSKNDQQLSLTEKKQLISVIFFFTSKNMQKLRKREKKFFFFIKYHVQYGTGKPQGGKRWAMWFHLSNVGKFSNFIPSVVREALIKFDSPRPLVTFPFPFSLFFFLFFFISTYFIYSKIQSLKSLQSFKKNLFLSLFSVLFP